MLLAAMTLLASADTDAPNPDLLAELKSHRLELSAEAPDTYSGSGWERLVAEASEAQFLMVGEQHATADIAAFEVALQRRLLDHGYTHVALEVGPYSARFAERLARSGTNALAAYLRQPGYGFTIPFLFFEDELPMVQNVVARTPGDTGHVWGLDQEFVGAMPILLDLLRPHATTAAQKQAIGRLEERSRADPMLVAKLTSSDVDALAQTYASADEEARGIVEAIRVTSDIYGPFTRRTGPIYPANLTRETYMKRNFMAQFEAAAAKASAPKVFLKFGGYHAMRGMSGTNVPAFTNFLAEWGLSRGYKTVNMFIGCEGGQALDPQSGKPGPCESYFGPDDPVRSALGSGKITMFDLKAVRPFLDRAKSADPRLRELILAFDYYIVIRDVRAATPVSKEFGTPK